MKDQDLVRLVWPEEEAKVPGHLFKYRPLLDPRWARDLIVNQTLYFPAAAALNDPFDCKPYLVTTSTRGQRQRYIRGFLRRTMANSPRAERHRLEREILDDMPRFIETMKRSHAQSMAAMGVYSLAENPLCLLMWPHYGNEHRGICVRYRTQALLEEGHVPFRVTYAPSRPVANPIIEEPEAATLRSVLTKGEAWSYEKEFRLVQANGGGRAVTLRTHVIDGVILGARISDEHRDLVSGGVQDARWPIEVFQAHFHPSEYAVGLEKVK